MRKSLIIAGTAAAALTLGLGVLPASAATVNPTGPTVTTFVISSGDLTLTVPATAALTTEPAGTLVIPGTLGLTTVTDARGGVLGWVASAASTTFVEGSANAGSISSAVTYLPGAVAITGTVTATPIAAAGAIQPGPTAVVTATGVAGNNTASWTPAITVTLPSTAVAGTYTGSITSSVA